MRHLLLVTPSWRRAAATVALAALLVSCGGGGGTSSGGSATVNIFNVATVDADGLPDGDCSGPGGGPNPYDIVSVTFRLVSPIGPTATITFSPPIPPGGMAPIPGGFAPGTYRFNVTFSGTGAQETDQCPDDTIFLSPDTATDIHFEY